jgi:hypothetical protein
MICDCGGIFNVIAVEEAPNELPKEKKLIYDRVCDVQCLDCGKILFSQPYDFGKRVNEVKGNMKKVYSNE